MVLNKYFLMLDFNTIITLSICNFLLLIYFYIMLLHLIFKRVKYKIKSRKVLAKHIFVLFLFFLFLTVLFIWCFLRKDYVFDIIKFYSTAFKFLSSTWLSEVLLLTLFFSFGFMFLILLFITIYNAVKSSTEILLIYFYQYEIVSNFCSFYIKCCRKFSTLLENFVERFTKNDALLNIAFLIWPKSWYILRKLLYFGLLPYLIYFDLLTNDFKIAKIFYVLSWFFLYSLWYSLNMFFQRLLRSDFRLKTFKFYKR